MKKLNLAIITLLLVFQTVLSPISVFADENELSSPATLDDGTNPGALQASPSDEVDGDNNLEKDNPTGDTAVDNNGDAETEGTEEDDSAGADSGGDSTGDGDVGEEGNLEEETGEELNPDVLQGEESLAKGAPITENIIKSIELWDTAPDNGAIPPDAQKLIDKNPEVSDVAYIELRWEVPVNDSYDVGSTFTFQLPEQFKAGASQNGDLTGDDGLIGTYEITGRQVTFTFTEDPKGLQGYFFVGRGFDSSKLGNSTDVSIPFEFAGNVIQTIDLKFKSPISTGMTKLGTPDREKNPTKIDWTVQFNQSESKLNSAIFKDKLPVGLAIDKSTIVVKKLNISLTGDITEGDILSAVPDITYNSITGEELSIPLGAISSAYQVTYTTNIVEDFTGSQSFTNSAKLYDDTTEKESKSDTVKVSFNEPLNKIAGNYDAVDGTIEWIVEYNYNQKNVDGSLIDTMDNQQTFDEIVSIKPIATFKLDGKVESYGAALPNPNSFVTDSGADTFEINLPQGTTAYEIKYKTKLKDRVVGSSTVKNKVSMQAGSIETEWIEKELSQVVLEKTASVNYQKKEITWTLKVNHDKRNMGSVIVRDDFGRNLTLTDKTDIKGTNGTIKLIDDSGAVSDTAIATTKGFEIHYNNLNTAETITYTTKFDPTQFRGPYENTAKIGNYDQVDPTKFIVIGSTTQTKEVSLGSYTNDNGAKTGVYDATTKTIKWTIITNYNLHSLSNAIVKDTYTGDQEFVLDSFKVEQLTLKTGENQLGNGTVKCQGAACEGLKLNSQGFEYTLGPITDAYRITYETSLMGKVVATSYSNNATLQDGSAGSSIFEKSVTVSPTHGDKYLLKAGQQGKNTEEDLAKWKLVINPSQSSVPAGATVSDSINGDTKLIESSFELYKITVPSSGAIPTINSANVVDIGIPNGDNVKKMTLSTTDSTADYYLNLDATTGKSFQLTFKNAIEEPYILVYKSFIMGLNGEKITNSASFAGTSISSGQLDDNKQFNIMWAAAGGGATNGKGQLKISKVDKDTNKPLAGAEFTLYNASGEVELEKLVTNANGEAITQGSYVIKSYQLKETKAPEGYQTITPNPMTVKFTKDTTSGLGIATIKNEVIAGASCTNFTFTVKDQNNGVRKNITIEVKDRTTGEVKKTVTIGEDGLGKITASDDISKGTYDVFEGKVNLGTINVSFNAGQCQDELVPAPACPVFTITVKDVNGVVEASKTVIIKDGKDQIIETRSTDIEGKLILSDKTKYEQDKEYFVYDEESTLIGEVTVSYVAGLCQSEVQPAPSAACSLFSIIVKDEDGNVKPDAEVTLTVNVKDPITDDITVELLQLTANDKGKVILPAGTVPGTYTVTDTNDSSKILGNVSVSYKDGECQGNVQYPKICTIFEITVIGPDGTSPKANTKVIVKDETGTETPYTTDGDGKIKLPPSQTPGKVTVYEVNPDDSIGEKIDEVTVTYTKDCEAPVIKNACNNFTLTVNNKDLQPVGANVKVTIKNQAGQVITTGKTDEKGQIIFSDKGLLQQGQSYKVFNESGVELGGITVSYINEVCGAVVQVPDNACPIFTLTIQDINGKPRESVAFTIKDKNGSTIATGATDVSGKGTIPYTVEPGTYYVYEGSSLISAIVVKDCEAIAKPVYTGGGGGGSTPDPGNPEEPNKPTPDPGNPEEPNKPTPDPGNPEEPNKPTPDPGNSENPNKPTPGNPEDPNKPNPDPGKPVDPEKPSTNPGNPSTDSKDPTSPGKPGTSKPSVQDVIEQGKNLPPYNPSTATKDKLDAYKDFLNKYNQLSQEEQANVAKTLDINKIKEDAKRLEAQLKAQGKLPQTDGATQIGLSLIGVVLVLGALFFLRRRNIEMQ